MRKSVLTLLFCSAPVAVLFSQAPADSLATPEARNLLCYLQSLKSLTSNKVVSGQLHMDHVITILNETGKAPGLMGENFPDPNNWDGWGDATTRVQNMLDQWNAGGIPEWSVFIGNPVSMKGLRDRTRDGTNPLTLADIESVYTPGTAANSNYNGQLDKVAAQLKWLSDRHVPVIYRPLHEMNQSGWWYGDWQQNGNPVAYKTLWQYTFNYLTKTKGLHNMLWAYATAVYNGSTPGSGNWEHAGYYPGAAYVDIVGVDLYPTSWCTGAISANECSAYTDLKPLNKVMALCECGPSQCGHKEDYRKLVAAIKTYMPDVSYWMSWSTIWSMRAADNDYVNETLNDPWVCNRDEIPNLKSPVNYCGGTCNKPTTGVNLNKTNISLQLCRTEQLSAAIAPIDACDPSITWTSDNTAVATVDASGLVTAVATGTANITVKTNSGGFTKTCAVTVTEIQTAYNNVTRTIPGRTEAEDYDTGGECVAYHDTQPGNNFTGTPYRNEDVDIKVTGDSQGGGYDVGQGFNGEWLEYTLDATAGTYDINARVGSANSGNQLVVKLDGTVLGTINVPNMGNWNDKSTQTISGVNIPGGTKKILRLEIVGNGVDINWVEFINTTTGIVSNATSAGISVYPNPTPGTFILSYPSQDKNTVLSITDVLGRIILSRQYEPAGIQDRLDLSGFPNGVYIIKLENKNLIKTMKLIKQ